MLTVLMATRNGERTLPLVLEAFARLEAPASGWKLVVIDNGSTDRTGDIVGGFEEALPLTYVWEGAPGKNAALNAGLAYLEGDLAVFTDDDVLPFPDWLVRLRAAADANPLFAMFGGVIVPSWETKPPDWLQWLDQGHLFSATDVRLREGPMKPEAIFGPNMAIRAEVFEAGARFDRSIGPSGPNYAMGSETELLQRLGSSGHRAWHVETAVVEHIVRRHQMDRKWVLGRAFRFGRGMYRLQRMGETESLVPWAARMVLKMARRGLRIAGAAFLADEKELWAARWDLHYFRGLLAEARSGLQEKMAPRQAPLALATRMGGDEPGAR